MFLKSQENIKCSPKRERASSRLRKDNAAGNFVTQYYAQIVGLSERHHYIVFQIVEFSFKRVVEWNVKGKSRFKSSKLSHRCSNVNAKFQFFFWNTTRSFSFEAYRQLILYFTIHTHSGAQLQTADWRGENIFKSGKFLYHKYKRGMRETNVSSLC